VGVRSDLRLDSRRLGRARSCSADGGQEEAAPSKVLIVPLKRGKSQTAIARNIGTLVSEGYPRDQAIAIAHDHARRSNKGKKK